MKDLCTYDIGRAVCVETAFVGTNAGAKAVADAARRAAAAIVNFIVVFALVFEVQMVGWLSWHQALCRAATLSGGDAWKHPKPQNFLTTDGLFCVCQQ